MAYILGMNFKAFRNTGTFGSPTWDEVPNFANGRMTGAVDMFDARRRASGFFKQWAATGLDLGMAWRMLWDLADTDFTTILAAWHGGTEIDMIFLSGSSASGAHQGPRMSATFAKCDRGEDEDELAYAEIECKPGIGFVPSWFTGAS